MSFSKPVASSRGTILIQALMSLALLVPSSVIAAREHTMHEGDKGLDRHDVMSRVDRPLVELLDELGRPFEMRMTAPFLPLVHFDTGVFVKMNLLEDLMMGQHPAVALADIGRQQGRGEISVGGGTSN